MVIFVCILVAFLSDFFLHCDNALAELFVFFILTNLTESSLTLLGLRSFFLERIRFLAITIDLGNTLN